MRQLTGYDEKNWPVWGARITASNELPYDDRNNPRGIQGWSQISFPEATDNGMFVTYNTSAGATPGEDYHLGGLNPNGSGWSWRASPGKEITSPDGKGTFPDITSCDGNAGVSVFVEGSNVFEGFNGNYCSVSSQWMHWSEDGLLIGQFGHVAYGFPPGEGYPAGAAGNIAMMNTVAYQGKIYLYTSDESIHPGVHQWTINGLNTIKEVSGWANLGATTSLQ